MIGEGVEHILFIHGFGLTLHTWKYIKDKFDKKRYKLILIDLKGCGFSDRPKNSDYSINEQANIIISLLESLKIQNIKIIGHSYGGIITLYLHYLANEKKHNINIDKTVLLDTPAYNDFIPLFMKILKNGFLGFLFPKIVSPKYISKLIIKNTFYDKEQAIKKLLPQYMFFFGLKDYNESLTELSEQLIPKNVDEVIKNYKNIRLPVLIIRGDNDTLIDASQSIRLNKDIANSSLKIVERCGHVPHEEQPDITFDLIHTFFQNERN